MSNRRKRKKSSALMTSNKRQQQSVTKRHEVSVTDANIDTNATISRRIIVENGRTVTEEKEYRSSNEHNVRRAEVQEMSVKMSTTMEILEKGSCQDLARLSTCCKDLLSVIQPTLEMFEDEYGHHWFADPSKDVISIALDQYDGMPLVLVSWSTILETMIPIDVETMNNLVSYKIAWCAEYAGQDIYDDVFSDDVHATTLKVKSVDTMTCEAILMFSSERFAVKDLIIRVKGVDAAMLLTIPNDKRGHNLLLAKSRRAKDMFDKIK